MSELTPICKHCHAFLWEWEKKPHRCPPKYKIICDDYDPERIWDIYANDIEAAVEKWAEEYDREDISDIANGMGSTSMEVRVWSPQTGQWSTWKVTGEWTPEYRAEPVT